MDAIGLGRFGDRRLEKGGPFFWGVWLRVAGLARVSGGWAWVGLARCGLRGFSTTQR